LCRNDGFNLATSYWIELPGNSLQSEEFSRTIYLHPKVHSTNKLRFDSPETDLQAPGKSGMKTIWESPNTACGPDQFAEPTEWL